MVALGAFASDKPWGVTVINGLTAVMVLIGYFSILQMKGLPGLLYLMNAAFFIRMILFSRLSQKNIHLNIPWSKHIVLYSVFTVFNIMLVLQYDNVWLITFAPLALFLTAILLGLKFLPFSLKNLIFRQLFVSVRPITPKK